MIKSWKTSITIQSIHGWRTPGVLCFLLLSLPLFAQSDPPSGAAGDSGNTAVLSSETAVGAAGDVMADAEGGAAVSSARPILERMHDCLAWSLEELVEEMGLPDDIYPMRGPTEGQDSVVFYYYDSFTFYMADGHIWQVRADRNDLFERDRLSLGESRENVTAYLGEPGAAGEGFLVYGLPRKGFPVAAALYFEGGLADLYVYRSDF